MNPFGSAFFHTTLLAALLGFGFGAVCSSLFATPRWIVEELSK